MFREVVRHVVEKEVREAGSARRNIIVSGNSRGAAWTLQLALAHANWVVEGILQIVRGSRRISPHGASPLSRGSFEYAAASAHPKAVLEYEAASAHPNRRTDTDAVV